MFFQLIEKLEDSLVEDLDTSQDAETLSRNIVEKLDEISALREQAEMDVPIETIMEEMQDEEDDEEEFDTEEQVIDWYNRVSDLFIQCFFSKLWCEDKMEYSGFKD